MKFSHQKSLYITSLNRRSKSGDHVHVSNVVRAGKFNHLNRRFFALWILLWRTRQQRKVIRESVDLLAVAFLPTVIVRTILRNVIIEINGSIIDETRQVWIQKLQGRILRCCEIVVFVSDGLRLRFENLYGESKRFRVIPNGGPEAESVANIINGPLRFAFVGADTQWQDVDGALTTLRNFARVSETPMNVHIAGNGFSDRKPIEEKNFRVSFEGEVEPAKAKTIYESANILIYPDTRSYNGKMLSSSIKVYECLSINRLIWSVYDRAHQEFAFAKDKFVDLDDLTDREILNRKIVSEFVPRTWEDVARELQAL